MRENQILAGLLGVVLVVSYASWTRIDPKAKPDTRVTILEGTVDELDSIIFQTKNATIAIAKSTKPEASVRFDVESAGKKRFFVGNQKATERLAAFAPFRAARSLGRELGTKEIEAIGLSKPERSLRIGIAGRTTVFDVGGQTSGARDHYVRSRGGAEVFIVASKVLSDLEYPDSQYMQRDLVEKPPTEVAKIVLSASNRTKTIVQQNRLAKGDAYWASEAQPTEPNKTFENYVEKLRQLTAVEYVDDPKAMDGATPVMTSEWFDEKGASIGTVELFRKGGGADAEYLARSTATRMAVKVAAQVASTIEKDLDGILGSE